MTTITNVFASPGEAFSSLAGAESGVLHWLAPLLATVVLVFAYTFILANNPTIHAQFLDNQRTAMDKMVSEGRLTQEQADMQLDRMESGGSSMFLIFGVVFGSITAAIFYFGAALVVWLTAKFGMKATQGYGKFLELSGTASWIGILGSIVTLLLWIGLGSMFASPSAAMAVLSSYDATDKVHRLLSALNVFSIWQTGVLGIGLSKFSGKSTNVGLAVAFGLWIAWVAVSVLTGFGR